jgi:large subunit ribosomal protein L21
LPGQIAISFGLKHARRRVPRRLLAGRLRVSTRSRLKGKPCFPSLNCLESRARLHPGARFLDEFTMHAVIKTGGKQYRVSAGDKLNVETLPVEAGGDVAFDQVLMLSDGDNIEIGAPFLAGVTVTAKVVEHGRGEKIRIVKFKRRKHYKRQAGHRQNYTRVEITGVARG